MKHVRYIAPAGAAAAAVAGGLVLPFEAYLLLVAGALVMCMLVMAFVAQVQKPFVGWVLLVAMGAAFPVEFRGPAGVLMGLTLPVAAMLCGFWILQLATTARRPVVFEASRIVYVLIGFMGIVMASFVAGQFPWFRSGGAPLPAQMAELGLFLISGCVMLAVGHQLKQIVQLKWIVWAFIAAGGVACALQMLPPLNFIARLTTRPGSVGSLFWTWLVAMSLAQALFNRRLAPAVRLALIGLTGLVLFHGFVQVRSWASGWVPLLASLAVIFLIRFPRFGVGLSVLGCALGALIGGEILQSVLTDESYSLMTRQEAWGVLWQIVERSPLLGVGPANYYYYTENLSLLGWYVRFVSHNNYQDLLVQTGFLGLLVFGWFAIECYRMLRRLYVFATPGFSRAYAVGALGGLTGSLAAGMLGDWIIPFYYNGGLLGFRSSLLFWVFLGGALALKRIDAAPAPAHVFVQERADAHRRYERLVEAH